jgi:hypothetical protein
MKSSIRTFVLAAIAAASFTATTHSASAQLLYANTTPADHVLPFDAIATINAIIVPSAGTYVLSGQQTFIVAGTQQTTVSCWLSTAAGNRAASLRYGPVVEATVQSGGSYVTLPLNGYFFASGPTEIYVECEYVAPSTATIVQSLTGNIMAVSMKN